jgi:hypothetical protein
MDKVREQTQPDPDGWFRVTGLTWDEAEQLLDWLENQALTQHELVVHAESGCTVRWRTP